MRNKDEKENNERVKRDEKFTVPVFDSEALVSCFDIPDEPRMMDS